MIGATPDFDTTLPILLKIPSATQKMLENESVTGCLQTLTNMQLNCLCPQLLKMGCACSDYFCFRNQMNSGPLDPVVYPRLKECPLLSKLLYEPHSNQCESQLISYAVAQEASWTFAKLTAPSRIS
jgi:hypothetical protein